MNLKKHLLETATLIAAAVLCAVVANMLASRDRKLAFVADYPNALVVPGSREPAPTATPFVTSESTPTEAANGERAADTVETTTASAVKSTVLDDPLVAPETLSPKPLETVLVSPPATPLHQNATLEAMIARYPPHDATPYVEVAPSDVDWLYDNGVLFLDARRSRDYEAGHIRGAKSFPIWEAGIDDQVAAMANEALDGRRPIVIYCSGGDCEDSHMLAQKLWGILLNNVLVYKDGFPDWQKRGRPVSRGSAP